MGREMLFKKLKKSGTILTIVGTFFTILAIGFVFIFAVADSLITGVLFAAFMLAFGIPMLIFGIRDLKNPMKNGIFKRNPNILVQVDNMSANKRYEDKFIMLSDRCIAKAKSFTEIAYLEDVFLVYIQKQRTNFVPTGKYIVICTATGDMMINVYGCKKATIDEIADKIGKVCPNVRFGYNNEGLAYLAQMKELYKNNSGMINHRGYVQNEVVLPQYMNNANMQNQLNQNPYYNNGYNQYYSNNDYAAGTNNQNLYN